MAEMAEMVSRQPVTLDYVIELDSTMQTGVLASTTVLYKAKARLATDEGVFVKRGATIRMSKRVSWFSGGRGHVKGTDAAVTVPGRKLILKKREQWTVENVLDCVIKPAVAELPGPLASALDPRHLCDDMANAYFVSTPREVWFSGFVAALKEFFKGKDPKQVWLWMDIIHLDQFERDLAKVQAFEADLPEFMGNFKGHLVYFDGWGAPSNKRHRRHMTALTDARCLWETYGAKLSGLQTHVVMRPPTLSEMLQSCRDGGLAFFEDELRRLVLGDESPRLVDLAALVADVDGGKHAILHGVRDQLEFWFVRQFAKQAGKIKDKQDIVYEQAARDLNRVAVVHSRNGDQETATRLFRDVIALREAARGKDDPATAYAKNNLALILKRRGEFEEARALLQEAIDTLAECEEGPDSAQREAVMVGNLATVLEELGELEAALAQRELLLRARRDEFGERDARVARVLNSVGVLLTKLRRLAEAKETLLEALAIWEEQSGHDEERLQETVENLATVYELEMHHDHPDHGGDHHVDIAKTLYNLAMIYKHAEEEEHNHHASEYQERALAIMQDVLGDEHPETQKYRQDLLTDE